MFTSTNPSDIKEVIATVPEASANEILTVLRTAKTAQKSWAKLPAPTRGRIIANVGRLVESNKEALAKLITKEMGKVYSEALGEVQEVVDTCALVKAVAYTDRLCQVRCRIRIYSPSECQLAMYS